MRSPLRALARTRLLTPTTRRPVGPVLTGAPAGPSARPALRARTRSGLAAMLVASGLVLVGGTGAQAHDTLLSTDPPSGATVPHAPEAITLTFSAPALAIGTKVVVTTPDGRDAADGEPELADATVRQAVAGYLPAGEYTVAWRATSADGHPIEGTFTFTAADAVGAPEPTATPSTQPRPTSEAAADQPTSPAEPTPSAVERGARGGGPASFVIGALFAALAVGAAAVWWSVQRSRGSGT